MNATVVVIRPGEPTSALPLYVEAEATFADLYEREYSTLIAMGIAFTGSRWDGEDLVQETMVRALLNWDRVRKFPRPAGWCVRVLTNLSRDRWRRMRVERRAFAKVAAGSNRSVDGISVESLAFWQSVRRLPTRWRTVMVLFYAGDRTTAEVAAILGVPEGTVRSDLARARRALATEME